MNLNILPFNLELLNINNIDKSKFKQIKSLDVFEGSTKNFHPEGLFSQEIFGKYGTLERQTQFGYIDLRCNILHPVIYKIVITLKSYYEDILKGTQYAIWNTKEKIFVKSEPGIGSTGYSFFMEHFKELKFEGTDSKVRDIKIELLDKYKDISILNKLVVLPAGLRDYEVDEEGMAKKNEVNDYYTKILSLTNLIDENLLKIDPSALDRPRYNLQLRVQELYKYFSGLLEGKKKLIQQKWATRKLFNGTRNVITALINDTDELNSDRVVSFNQSVVGLYEFIKMYQPLSMFNIRQLVSKALVGANEQAFLINKKTLHKEPVVIDSNDYDAWMSDEGLEKTLTYFGTTEARHNILEISGKYMFLIYLPNDRYFKVIQDIDEIPERWKKKYPNAIIRPMTFCELLYISMYKIANTLPAFLTRFPCASLGSSYPTMCYLRTTVIGEKRLEISDDWENIATDENGKVIEALQYPKYEADFFQTISPHPSHLVRLTADFDGDTVSLNSVYSDEARSEVIKTLKSKKYYVGPDGRMLFSISHDTLNYVLKSLTK